MSHWQASGSAAVSLPRRPPPPLLSFDFSHAFAFARLIIVVIVEWRDDFSILQT